MDHGSLVLVLTVAAVGVLHTIVPDHWAPIVVIARGQGWTQSQTARAAAIAGFGHVASTLLIGAVVWAAGAVLAARYAHAVSLGSAIALIAFGAWIAYAGWRELGAGHAHAHRHADGTEHIHWHAHDPGQLHAIESGVAVLHEHDHGTNARTALLLILGSSPMIEGIPAFLSASTRGATLLATMSVVFAAATIVTYVAMCLIGTRGLERTSLGPLERYGEVLSGCVVAIVGIYALVTA